MLLLPKKPHERKAHPLALVVASSVTLTFYMKMEELFQSCPMSDRVVSEDTLSFEEQVDSLQPTVACSQEEEYAAWRRKRIVWHHRSM